MIPQLLIPYRIVVLQQSEFGGFVDEISRLSLVEVAKLSSILMKRMGMKDPPVVGVMKPGAAGLAGVAIGTNSIRGEET